MAFLFFVMVAAWRQWPALKSTIPQVRRWQRWPDTRGNNPDEVLAAARTKVSRLERAIDALGDSESAEARWLGVALQEACRAAQERPLAVQVEECQAFIERSRNRLTRLEQERVAEQKELDAAVVRLTRLREEMVRVPSPAHAAVASPVAARSFNGRNFSVESTSRRVGGGKGRAPQEACKIPVGPCSRFARGVVPEHRPVAGSCPGQS